MHSVSAFSSADSVRGYVSRFEATTVLRECNFASVGTLQMVFHEFDGLKEVLVSGGERVEFPCQETEAKIEKLDTEEEVLIWDTLHPPSKISKKSILIISQQDGVMSEMFITQ